MQRGLIPIAWAVTVLTLAACNSAGLGATSDDLHASPLDLSVPPAPDLSAPDDLALPDLALPDLAQPDLAPHLKAPVFAPPVSYPAGVQPLDLVVGDLNSDGHADLVAYDGQDGNLKALLGAGNGTFGKPIASGGGFGGIGSLALGDLDEDGALDAVVAQGAGITLLLGKKSGAFADTGHPVAIQSARALAIEDLDRDGHLDVVVVGGDTISTLRGAGDGSLGAPVALPKIAWTLRAVTTADLDGSGQPDLIVTNIALDQVYVLLSDGRGGFGAPSTLQVDGNPRNTAVADFDGDGRLDLTTSQPLSKAPEVISVTLAKKGGFQPRKSLLAGEEPIFVVVADFNRDGRPDLAVANYSANTVSVLAGSGQGTFAPAVASPSGRTPFALVTADFNEDGLPDLASSSGAATVSILLNLTH